MRLKLLWNPRLLCERLAIESKRRRRLARLRGTVAHGLALGHIDSLELLELLRPNPPRVIYDIGANVGTWTLLAKALFPTAEVHAFEPLSRLAEQFAVRTANVSGVIRHGVALGASASSQPMKIADVVDASSLLAMTEMSTRHFHVRPESEETVTVERLDEYVNRLSMPLPNLVKLDIQGYELEALRGAERCLEAANAVLSEVSFVEFYRGQCAFHEVVDFLGKRGFHLIALGEHTRLGSLLLQTDALFVVDALRSQLAG